VLTSTLSLSAPLAVALACCLQHVEGHHGVIVEDDSVVGLDEAHASHVCREVENVVASGHNFLAVLEHAQVHQVELVTESLLLTDECACAGRESSVPTRNRSKLWVLLLEEEVPPFCWHPQRRAKN